MRDVILTEKGLVIRHSLIERIEHWAIALSGLVLLITGIFELPLANRYYITSVPGLGWSGDFVKTLSIHYAASVVFIAAALFHSIYHGILGERGMIPRRGDLQASLEVIKSFFGKGAEPPFHKYLPEQRLAYAGMAVIIAMLILSGLVKTYKNIYAPDMSFTLVFWATWVHNLFFVFFILSFFVHIGALVLKPNRPLIRGIFAGTVALDYARRRHPLWIREMEAESEDLAGSESGHASPILQDGITDTQDASNGPPRPVIPDRTDATIQADDAASADADACDSGCASKAERPLSPLKRPAFPKDREAV